MELEAWGWDENWARQFEALGFGDVREPGRV